MEVLELDCNPEPSGPLIRELVYTSGYAPRVPSLSWVLSSESLRLPLEWALRSHAKRLRQSPRQVLTLSHPVRHSSLQRVSRDGASTGASPFMVGSTMVGADSARRFHL